MEYFKEIFQRNELPPWCEEESVATEHYPIQLYWLIPIESVANINFCFIYFKSDCIW